MMTMHMKSITITSYLPPTNLRFLSSVRIIQIFKYILLPQFVALASHEFVIFLVKIDIYICTYHILAIQTGSEIESVQYIYI